MVNNLRWYYNNTICNKQRPRNPQHFVVTAILYKKKCNFFFQLWVKQGQIITCWVFFCCPDFTSLTGLVNSKGNLQHHNRHILFSSVEEGMFTTPVIFFFCFFFCLCPCSLGEIFLTEPSHDSKRFGQIYCTRQDFYCYFSLLDKIQTSPLIVLCLPSIAYLMSECHMTHVWMEASETQGKYCQWFSSRLCAPLPYI